MPAPNASRDARLQLERGTASRPRGAAAERRLERTESFFAVEPCGGEEGERALERHGGVGSLHRASTQHLEGAGVTAGGGAHALRERDFHLIAFNTSY